MNPTNFDYSLKNIPIPSKQLYTKSLIDKVENFLKRLRWKAYFFDRASDGIASNIEHISFGFKSQKTPPQHDLLAGFESDMYDMIQNIQFREYKNDFLATLDDDVRKINSCSNILVFADKTNNTYELTREKYSQLLHNNITKSYQKAEPNMKNSIDREAKHLAKRINLEDRMESYAERPAYITLKDHKDNFNNKLPCRLINPAKPEIGIVSKKYLEKINSEVLERTGVMQWRNTRTVIEWFKSIPNKTKARFIKFDIAEFYPSINEPLLEDALNFAKSMTEISDEAKNAIKLSRKSLLFSQDGTWVKKGDNPLFDVTMGSYDVAEICELVGTYMLNKLTSIVPKEDIGLYRDDGIMVVHEANGPKLDRLRKDIVKIFKDKQLNITIDTNLKITEFLDVTLDLDTGKYYPYKKPNDTTRYINSKSNHPPSITKQLPIMVNKRISELSCDEQEFNKVKKTYEKSLTDSGFDYKMQYCGDENSNSENKRHRLRNVIWFNPPFNSSVKSNVGKIFLNLVKKHFPPSSRLHKIFNRNTLKISYSCTSNMANIVKQHNRKVLSDHGVNQTRPCNCRDKSNCPLDGKCLATNIIYEAKLITNDATMLYYGTSENEFKYRYNNHTKSFRHIKYKNESELSKAVWSLKDDGKEFTIRWSIAKSAAPYKAGSKRCDLCLSEKVCIIRSRSKELLNKRNELISKCRHKNKFVIGNVK